MFNIKGRILDLYSIEEIKENLSSRESRKSKEELLEENLDMERRRFSDVLDVVFTRARQDVFRDELWLLKSFRKIISLDLAYSSMSSITNSFNRAPFRLYIPGYYFDSNGERVTLPRERTKATIRDKIVVEMPYDTVKWKTHLTKEDDLNPEKYREPGVPYYYPELNLVLQGAGSVHRTAEAFLNGREGLGVVVKCDDAALYEHIETDGAYWIDFDSGQTIDTVGDFRLAVVFAIRKREKMLEIKSLD